MKLYTAGSTKANRESCQRLGVGLLIVDHWRDPTAYPYFAIDNGCYSAWSRGIPWDPARIHVGRIGTPGRMILAHMAGVDSIDSTTWVQRNGCLEHHVREYRERVGAE